ncbi:hypothetical protein [Streptomyces sp. NPDC054837]
MYSEGLFGPAQLGRPGPEPGAPGFPDVRQDRQLPGRQPPMPASRAEQPRAAAARDDRGERTAR